MVTTTCVPHAECSMPVRRGIDGQRLRVLFACAEMVPFAKTGGLADVTAALPVALAGHRVDVRVLMPGYPQALDRTVGKRRLMTVARLPTVGAVDLIAGRTPDSNLPVLLVDCPALYARSGLYQDASGQDWPDNAIRFGVLSHVAARLGLGADSSWQPHVVHMHDWHLGFAAALLAHAPGQRPATVFTIHNMAFQGLFSPDILPAIGASSRWFTPDGIEFYGNVSFLKAGMRFADRVTTVSPSYAREILTPEFGCGLDGLLRSRASGLVGILNGIDQDRWNPSSASDADMRYDTADLSGKARSKTALQKRFGLTSAPQGPLIAFVSRLTEQKMADLLLEVAPTAIAQDAQLVIVGQGQRSIEDGLRALPDRYKGHIAVHVGYHDDLARSVLAGADLLLSPARFEPCGLIQMYAMRYGTLPIVRRVGGLADTVIDTPTGNLRDADEGTGFVFERPTAQDLSDTIVRACRLYRAPQPWHRLRARAMAQDFSWRRSAEQYVELYRSVSRAPGGQAPSLRTSSAQGQHRHGRTNGRIVARKSDRFQDLELRRAT